MHLATHIDLLNLFQDLKIWFNYKSSLTSAISKLANCNILASYVSRHNAMAYDRVRNHAKVLLRAWWYLNFSLRYLNIQVCAGSIITEPEKVGIKLFE
jgi:hypothetical protein